MSEPDVLDWTAGRAGIAYQRCARCKAVWYMRRSFCPHCGHGTALTRQADGCGVVYAVTVVTRAPSDALRAHAPYTLVLVDCDEGFRVMAHGTPGLRIGDRVQAGYFDFGGRLIPRFQPIANDQTR